MISSLLLLAVLPLQDSPIVEAAAPIERVTVYDGQALVERQFSVTATEPGAISIKIGPLPLGLDSSSFQTKLISGKVVVQGVEARTVTGTALDNSQRDGIRAELISLRAELRAKAHDRVAITAERAMLDALIKSIANGHTQAGVVADLKSVGETASALDQRLAVYEKQVEDLKQKISALDLRLGDGGRRLHRYKEGNVMVWFEKPGTAILTASYLIGGASWRPTYDVRVAPDLTGITVGLVAHLTQKTGEDWTDAVIALSTSTPSIGLDPPTLPVRVFNVRHQAPSAGWNSDAVTALGYLREEAEADASDERGRADLGLVSKKIAYKAAPSVQVEDLGLTALFLLPTRKTIVSDGESHRFRIREIPLDVEPERYVIPTLSDKAFLQAEVSLTGDAPMLPGVAKIFLGPDYLGESQFPVLRPGDSTTINLGVDPNLSITWETVVDKRDEPGLLSSTATLTRVYRASLKLSANAPGEILVVMEEALPLVRSSNLTLVPVEMRPAPENSEGALKLQEEKGLYQWRINLAPGQAQNIYWGYELEFDEDYNPLLREE